MRKKADLHVHTTESDGKYSPEEVVKMAVERGLSALAITDHDTFAGYAKAKLATDSQIEIISGMECTCDFEGREIHVLAYGFNTEDESITSFAQKQKKLRVNRAEKMISKLSNMGYDLDINDVIAESGTWNISRNHIAKVLVKKGYASHTQQVFNKWLGNDLPAYFKADYKPVKETIDIIHNAGGVAVLAHPASYYSDQDIQYLIDCGLDGFECIHPSHPYNLQQKYATLCDERGLLKTGGSDFHGFKKSELTTLGTVSIDYDNVHVLKQACHKNSNELTI